MKMSKSVLVIETPRTCFGCPLMYDSYGENSLKLIGEVVKWAYID